MQGFSLIVFFLMLIRHKPASQRSTKGLVSKNDVIYDTALRLKALARSHGLSVNKLVEEMSNQAIAAFDVEVRFKALAASADRKKALALLDRLDGS